MSEAPLILVVDDSPIQRKIISAALRGDGYDVVVAENGREGVELALYHRPDLIVMDISMPEMDGLEATSVLRQYPEMADIPILAITAVSDPADLDEAYRAGYNDVVDKNSDRGVLLDAVHAWLAR